ncbi:MAG: hypothetical protein U5P41_05240 [Gammaproteobacteria bacterium]|nr:hypothetical protein [Gammaproteobacteria bacterium]
MDISREQVTYLEDDSFVSDDSMDSSVAGNCLEYDVNGIAWREIEKYRERKELESIIRDDLYYDGIDINSIWD